MQVLELTISQFGDFGFAAEFISDFEHVDDFAIEFCFVIDDFGFEVEHQFHLFIYCQSRNNILSNQKQQKRYSYRIESFS